MDDLKIIAKYEEAVIVARRMRCKTMDEYWKKWNEGLGLPYFPDIFYAGRGWPAGVSVEEAWNDFLCHDFPGYPPLDREIRINDKDIYFSSKVLKEFSYQEAKKFLWEHNVYDMKRYRELRRNELRLPKFPARFYADSWQGKKYFFAQSPGDVSYSFKEAKEVLQKIRFQTPAEYRRRCKIDIRLPRNANLYYEMEFKGWADYLNLYSLEQVREVIIRENIKSVSQLRRLSYQDVRLPHNLKLFKINDIQAYIDSVWQRQS